jgi:hypothetical protein
MFAPAGLDVAPELIARWARLSLWHGSEGVDNCGFDLVGHPAG